MCPGTPQLRGRDSGPNLLHSTFCPLQVKANCLPAASPYINQLSLGLVSNLVCDIALLLVILGFPPHASDQIEESRLRAYLSSAVLHRRILRSAMSGKHSVCMATPLPQAVGLLFCSHPGVDRIGSLKENLMYSVYMPYSIYLLYAPKELGLGRFGV